MTKLFDDFPNIRNDKIIIKKMVESDTEALKEISHNEAIYKFIPPFLYKKSEKFLQTAISNFSGRDFDKKKMIIAGIYLQEAPGRLIGLAEMFDYKRKTNTITIGYRINQRYWNQGVASSAIDLMVDYLHEMGIDTIRAFVMTENSYSSKALLKNGFIKQPDLVQQKNWGSQDIVEVEVYVR